MNDGEARLMHIKIQVVSSPDLFLAKKNERPTIDNNRKRERYNHIKKT